MIEKLARQFDWLVPQKIQYSIKEKFRMLEFHKENIFNNGLFTQVEVETNTSCNRSCKICPRKHSPRPHGFMDNSLYKSLLTQLSDIDFRGRFSPVFYNEPLLDGRLESLMEMARTHVPKMTIMVYTNGSLLTEKKIENLIDSGVDSIIVSQYEDNIERDDKSSLIANLPKKLKTHVRYRHLDDDMLLSNRAGSVDVKNAYERDKCYQASSSLVIDYEGNVILCCNDYFIEHRFGNISQEHIMDIWNSREFSMLRKELRKGIFDNDLCKRCVGVTSQATQYISPHPLQGDPRTVRPGG